MKLRRRWAARDDSLRGSLLCLGMLGIAGDADEWRAEFAALGVAACGLRVPLWGEVEFEQMMDEVKLVGEVVKA
jgi:hypothetical protein